MRTITLRRLRQITLIYFSLNMVCSIHVSVAQTEHEFVPIGAEWYYDNFLEQTNTIFYRQYTCLKDTTINAISLRMIERYRRDGINTDSIIQQCIHVSDNKVYEFENDTLYLLYDFNKTIGEYWIMPKYNDTIFIKDKYKSVLLNGDSCTYFVVRNSNNYWKHYLITDRFGDLYGLFPAPKTVGYSYDEIRCYYENNELLFSQGEYPCDYSNVSLNDILDNRNQLLYSNPVFDNLNLEFSIDDVNENSYIEIYNACGQKILNMMIHSQKMISIPFSSYTKGVYFMKVKTKNNVIETCKLIKL